MTGGSAGSRRVGAVPVLALDPGAAEPAVEPPVGRLRRLELVRRVGDPPARAVRRGEELVGVRGGRKLTALERAGAEREDPLPLEGGADLAHQVQVAVRQEAAEHVEAADRAVALDHVDLERAAAVAGDPVAHVRQRPLQAERLAHHVDRVGVLADVAEVGVAVVPDQVSLADRAEQGAVGRERVDAGLLQGAEHLLDRVQQGLHVLRAAGVEGLREAQRLVDPERQPALVDDGDPLVTVAEVHLLVVHDRAAHVLDDAQLRRPVQEPTQGRRPRHDVRAAARLTVAPQPERPDPAAVEEHVEDDLVLGPRPHPVVVDAHPGDVGGSGHVGIVREPSCQILKRS